MGFGSDFGAGFLSGVLTVGVVSIGTFVARDPLHDWLVSQDPSCAEPGDLTPLSDRDLTADESMGAADPSFGKQPSDAVDGYAGSWWVPALADPHADPDDKHTWHVAQLQEDASTRTLVLDLDDEQDVRLVCVVNGLAESRTRYLMHGSVSAVTVWGEQRSGAKKQSLERLPAELMQTLQDAGTAIGKTSTIHLEVDAVASGETVLSNDPDDCYTAALGTQMNPLSDGETPQRVDQDGCIRAPVPQAGLAEVVVYVRE
jgi:hypothetical protein